MLLALDGVEDEVMSGWPAVEEGLLVDGGLLVRQVAGPLRGGDIDRRLTVGVSLADELDLDGAVT